MARLTYQQWFELAATTVRHMESHKFFRDGSARRAALAAVAAQEAGCSRSAIIDIVAGSLERDGHACYFDDPCDDFMVAA